MSESPRVESKGAPVLEFQDLSKTFKTGIRLKPVQAVRGVTLKVMPGEIFGYLGPNGAGKTTSMKMAMGLIRATSGSIRLFGRSVEDQSVRARIGYLPEQPYFYDYLTPWELLDFYGALFQIPKKERRARAEKLLDLVGLSHAIHRRLRGFSKGMLQRAGIAQTLINNPDLVVLDEPLSGLDPMGRKEVRDIVLNLGQQGTTVFFSSHILQDIEMICDRVALLNRGKLHSMGSLVDLLQNSDDSVDLVVESLSPEALSGIKGGGARVVTLGNSTTIQVPGSDVGAVLQTVLASGGAVLDLSRHRMSLEEYFVREASAAGDR